MPPSNKTLRRRHIALAPVNNNNSASEYEGETTKEQRKHFRELENMQTKIDTLLAEVDKYKNKNQAKMNNATKKLVNLEPEYLALIEKLPHKGNSYKPNLERSMRNTAGKRKNGTRRKFPPGFFNME
jgi:SMC interacting uncharacterized protein involved in chromosome segregation